MKKNLLLFVFLAVFAYSLTAQDKESDIIKNEPVLLDSGSILSQLKEQLGVQLKTQLKEQFETQVKTGFDSLSRKELNHAIDSMVLMLDEVIKQSKDVRSEEHTSELQSRPHLVCRLLLEKKKKKKTA